MSAAERENRRTREREELHHRSNRESEKEASSERTRHSRLAEGENRRDRKMG